MTIRVAIADDFEEIRKLLAIAFSMQSDITLVGQAANGQEAVDLARKTKPDVLVMDMNMPVMNGVEATRIIAMEQPNVRIIGMSAFAERGVADAMIAGGAARVLDKAGGVDDLIKAIRDVFASSRSLNTKITS